MKHLSLKCFLQKVSFPYKFAQFNYWHGRGTFESLSVFTLNSTMQHWDDAFACQHWYWANLSIQLKTVSYFCFMHSRMTSNLNMKDAWQTLKYVMYLSFLLVFFSLILDCLCSSLIGTSSLGLNPSNCHQNMSWTKRLTNARADMVQNYSDEVSVAHISPVTPFGKPPWKHCFHLPHQNHFSLQNASRTLCLARATNDHCWRCKPLFWQHCVIKALLTHTKLL